MSICSKCGQDNPDQARFCLSCGAALGTAPASREERKVVSVLFVDLVGFTSRSDRADPEDVRAALRPYHALLKREIERFGGTVEKFIGDAVMAVFGAPVAHEDDPERAVRAALRIIEAIRELNEDHPGMGLAVRAAVNTGEAVVTLGARPDEGEGIVAGDVVNTASRLQGVAPPGGVVVGEMTYRSTRHAVDYEPLEPVRVKGKAEPVAIWGALRALSRYAIEDERASTPFIGRDDELALLQQTFSRMVRESAVQLVTVTGEPGVGKSRLTAEFSSWVDDRQEPVSWRQGRCLPYGEGITFWALGEIVKGQAGILESDAPEEARGKLAEAVDAMVQQGPDREWLTSRLAPLVGLPAPQADREESFAAWRSFLESAAMERSLVLLVEDIHWADDAMLDFIEHVADWSTGAAILLLCTARPELYERRPNWGGGKRNATSIALSPLTDGETAQLVAALLSEAVLPAETQSALLERSGGNPLYAEEFIRMLTDRGILERKGRVVRLAEGAEIPVPETVQGLIAARLDTLPADRKGLLQDAAVVGKVFWAEAVAEMGGRDERSVRGDLHELSRKELLRPIRRSSMEDKTEYAFWHILIRDVAYGQIPRAARAAKHVAAAEWIEDLAGERVADHAELLAHHYTQALDLARASGMSERLQELEDRGRVFLVMAGERALRLDASKADLYFKDALTLFPEGHTDRPGLLVKAAEAARLVGRLSDAERGYREAIAAFVSIGDPSGAAGAKVRLADVLAVQGHSDRARDPLAEAIHQLESEPPSRGLASAFVLATRQGQWSGMPDEMALEYARKALTIAEEVGAREEAVRARQFVGFSRCNLGDRRGIEDLREALRLGLEWGLGVETGFGYLNLGDWVWLLEGPTSGLAVIEEGIAFAERRGIRLNATWMRAETTWMLFELGRWDEVVETADAVTAWERGRDGSQLQGMALPNKARVLLLRGRTADAAAIMQEVIPLAAQVGDLQVLLPALGAGAQVELARDDVASALRLVEQWLEPRAGSAWLGGLNLTDVLEVLVAGEELERARQVVAAFAPRSAHEDLALLTGRAIVAEASGEFEESAMLFAEAAASWQGFGNVVDAGRSLLGAGRCLVGLGRSGEAAERLRDAREFFVGLGATMLIAESDSWLERATALSS